MYQLQILTMVLVNKVNYWHERATSLFEMSHCLTLIYSPGSTVRVEQLLIAGVLNSDVTTHRTVVPLFTDVAGTVRVDCTVPEDVVVSDVIPRDDMLT